MNKISIRLTSFLLAIFSYVLIFQNIVSNQEQIPLNTNEQFEINIANTLITKEELALELDKIVDTNNATLIKIATPTNDYMYKNSKEFKELFKNSKGFCMHHFRDLVEVGEKKLSVKEKQEFYPVLFSLMEENMKRLEEEVTWFCDKQDYLNRNKDWGNSKDSIQRAIQKLGGGYPADPVFKIDY